MATPMGKMRVKIIFKNTRENPLDTIRKCWFLLDKDEIKDIDAFSKEIARRFGCSTKSNPQLFLDDCILPNWEKTEILRDNDEIWVKICNTKEPDNEEEELVTEHEKADKSPKKKKKKKKRKHSEPARDERLTLGKKRKRTRSASSSSAPDGDGDAPVCGGRCERPPRFKHDHGHHVISYDPPASPGVERAGNIQDTLVMSPGDMQVCAPAVPHLYACEVLPATGTSPSPAKVIKSAAHTPKDNTPTTEKARRTTSEAVGKTDDGLTPKQRRTRKRKRVKRMKASDKTPDGVPSGAPSTSKASVHQAQVQTNVNLGARAPAAMSVEKAPRNNFNGNRKSKANAVHGGKNNNRKHVIFQSDSGGETEAPLPSGIDNVVAEHSSMTGSPSIALRLQSISKNSDTPPEMLPSVQQCDQNTDETKKCEEIFLIVDGSEEASSDMQNNDVPRDSRDTCVRGDPRSGQTYTMNTETTAEQPARRANNIWASADSSGTTSFSKGPFANVQVFNRRQRRLQKKAGFVPLSKEEQLSTTATNHSTIYVNQAVTEVVEPTSPEETEPPEVSNSRTSDTEQPAPPPRDYTGFSDLLGPPRPGDKIAYKILEMNEVYCPEVSDYKEACVLSFDSSNQSLVLEQTPSNTKKKAGRFDLTIEDEDEVLTNDSSMESKVTLAWSAVLEPKLLT